MSILVKQDDQENRIYLWYETCYSGKKGSELFFQILEERHERCSIVTDSTRFCCLISIAKLYLILSVAGNQHILLSKFWGPL
jgi:hypothetical protein